MYQGNQTCVRCNKTYSWFFVDDKKKGANRAMTFINVNVTESHVKSFYPINGEYCVHIQCPECLKKEIITVPM